jgi:PAP2 superfamily/PEP-CTERM motif
MRSYNAQIKSRLATLTAFYVLAATTLVAMPASAAITIASDPILYWNDSANTLINNPTTGIPNAVIQTRAYAMMNIAMYDAVNATTGKFAPTYLSGVTSFGGDTRAAVAAAAYNVLTSVNSANSAAYQSAYSAALALIPDSAAKTNGIATGAAYAAAIIANRTGDGASTAGSVTYTTTGAPGDWRPTAPGFGAPAVPGWGLVKTFALSAADAAAVRPVAPPKLTDPAYTIAYNEVKDIVNVLKGANLTTEQQDQKNSALFWDVANGGTWIRVGLIVGENEGLNTLQYASAFATLSTGLADAGIEGFAAKYEYRLWRPVTAIQLGDNDTNPDTVGDPNWTPLFNTPAHPSYISTHSDLSATGAAILNAYFGDDFGPFSFTIGPDTRTFTSLSQARLDAANSRLWGGIHFRFDNEAGLKLGDDVSARVLSKGLFAVAVPEPSSWAMMIAGFGFVGLGLRGRTRRAAFSVC